MNNQVDLYKHSSRNGIQLFFIGFFLLTDSRFFYLLRLPDILGGSPFNKTLVGISALACTIILFFLNKKIILGNYYIYIILFYLFLLFQMSFEKFKYQYSMTTIIYNLIPYFVLTMYFGIGTYLDNQDHFSAFCLLCERITIILCLFLLAQLVIYNKSHIIFLNFTVSDWYTIYHTTEGGRFSVVADGLLKVTVLISFYDILKWKSQSTKRFLIALIAFLFGILSIIFVDQSRIYIIQTILSIICMYFIVVKDKIDFKVIFNIFIIAILSLILLIPRIASISGAVKDTTNGSSYARLGAISYYMSIIKDYLFTGLGIINPDKGTFQYWIIHGAEGIYYFDDIGIFGVLASMGILIMLWYLFIIVKNYKLTSKLQDNYQRALCFGLSTMMLLGVFTGSYLDKERLMALLLTMVVIDFCARFHQQFMEWLLIIIV